MNNMSTVNSAPDKQIFTIKAPGLISSTAARGSGATAIFALVLMAILHFVKPELQPSWHMVSEYAIGKNGWIMKLAFFSWALSCFLLIAAVRSQIQTKSGQAGLMLLFVVGISIVMAGIFVMDPPTANREDQTFHGNLHGLSAMIGIPGQAIAALLISFGLRRNPAWRSAKRSIMSTAHFAWISLVIMFASIFIMLGKTSGQFGPETLIGWPNRLMVLAYCLWLITIARHAIKICKGREG